jgi:hypothetical protein
MIKLAAEKSFNRNICPIMNIKGKTYSPRLYEINYYHLQWGADFGRSNVIVDFIGTKLITLFMGTRIFMAEFQQKTKEVRKNRVCTCQLASEIHNNNLSWDGIFQKEYSRKTKCLT